MFIENIRMAFASLRAAKLRSFLTMLGIIIGVAAVVAINAIGQGVKDSITTEVGGLGSNVLTIVSGAAPSGKAGSNFTAALGTSTLTAKDVVSISSVPNITSASSMSLLSGILAKESTTDTSSLVVATTPALPGIISDTVAEGRFFNPSDNTANVIVLGAKTKTNLFGSANAIGQTVSFRGTPLSVIGVLVAKDTGASLGPSQDAIAYMPAGTATTLTGTTPSILRIYAKVASADQVDSAVAHIKTVVIKEHGGQADFNVQTQADLLSTFNSILTLLTTFIAAIAGISLLVGGIGIMNIMLVNVTERTREIGLRKAIGASNSSVLSQFMIEALVISVFGGALGILVAVGMASLAGKLANIHPSFTLTSILVAVGVSASIGVIFGIAPAAKAARLRPIVALKSE